MSGITKRAEKHLILFEPEQITALSKIRTSESLSINWQVRKAVDEYLAKPENLKLCQK